MAARNNNQSTTDQPINQTKQSEIVELVKTQMKNKTND
jgi:hypothetical protein